MEPSNGGVRSANFAQPLQELSGNSDSAETSTSALYGGPNSSSSEWHTKFKIPDLQTFSHHV